MVKFRVVVKVGYYERWFEFNSATDASHFATLMLNHEVESEDHENVATKITMEVVKKSEKKEEAEEE